MHYGVRQYGCQLLTRCYTMINSTCRIPIMTAMGTQLIQTRSFLSCSVDDKRQPKLSHCWLRSLHSSRHLLQVPPENSVISAASKVKSILIDPKNRALLLKFTGNDELGVFAGLAEILHQCDAEVLDVDQLNVHGNVCIYVMVRDKSSPNNDMIRTLLTHTEENNISMSMTMVDADTLAQNRAKRGKYTYTITVMKNEIVGFDVLASVARHVAEAGFNIVRIERLSQLGAMLKANNLVAVEFLLEHCSDDISEARAKADELREQLIDVGQGLDCDMVLQRDGALRRNKRLVVMDMDSTIIQQEVIDELARCHGVYDEVAEVTELAMQGKMDFEDSLRQRVRCLKGLSKSALDDVYNIIELTPGADYFIKSLHKMGYRTAVISGGFIEICERLRQKLDLDYAFANQLEIKDDKLTGELLGPIVCPARKRDLLESLAQTERISLKQTIAIGDGANDLLMIGRAGLGIAFNAKPIVQKEAKYSINQYRLDAVLFLLGMRPKDLPPIKDHQDLHLHSF